MEFHLSLRSDHGQMVALFLSHHRPEWLQFGLELCMLEPKGQLCLPFWFTETPVMDLGEIGCPFSKP
ncbi:unnamed protein product [Sphagnum jensenii]|uniref:Uncharacterized protein n=1 Tax=Sphagnum jensenii TaxID=128206 RepID=A0ABP1B9Z8_9BRYO